MSRALNLWWKLASLIAVASIIVYPVLKSLTPMLVIGIAGLFLAFAVSLRPPRFFDRLLGLLYGGADRKWLFTVCGVALLLRVPFLLRPTIPMSDFRTYRESASHLAAGAGYDNLLYPPGQSAWLSIWIRLFGNDLRVLTIAQISAGLLTIVVLFYAFRRYSHQAARWAALAAAFYPSLMLWDGTLGHEVLDLLLLALLLLVYIAAMQSGRLAWWILMGTLGGLSVLVWPVMLLLPAFLVAALCFTGKNLRFIVTVTMLFLFPLTAVVGLWTARNFRVWHKFCLVSANFGSILYRSNNANSDGIYMDNVPGIPDSADLIDFDAKCMQAGIGFITSNPGKFLQLTAKRVVFLWGSDASMLDALLQGYPKSRTFLKPAAAAVLQFVWACFMGCWLIAAWQRPIDFRHDASAVLWCVFVIALIGTVHAVVEPFTRRHFVAIPFLAALVLPAYMNVLAQRLCAIGSSGRRNSSRHFSRNGIGASLSIPYLSEWRYKTKPDAEA